MSRTGPTRRPLAPIPCGLHDTGMQPSNLRQAGGCTHGQVHVHLRFPPREGSACVLVTRDLLEVCPLSRRGDVTTPIRSITERLWLAPAILCPAPQRTTLRYGLPPGRRSSGFTVFRSRNMDHLAPAFTPAILGVRVPRFKSEAAELRTFWLKPGQHLWLLKLNDACGSSLVLGMSSSLTPRPP